MRRTLLKVRLSEESIYTFIFATTVCKLQVKTITIFLFSFVLETC